MLSAIYVHACSAVNPPERFVVLVARISSVQQTQMQTQGSS